MYYYANKSIKNAKYNYTFCMAPLLKSDSCPRHTCVCISRNCITCCAKLAWSTPDVFHHAPQAAERGFHTPKPIKRWNRLSASAGLRFSCGRDRLTTTLYTRLTLSWNLPFFSLSSWLRGDPPLGGRVVAGGTNTPKSQQANPLGKGAMWGPLKEIPFSVVFSFAKFRQLPIQCTVYIVYSLMPNFPQHYQRSLIHRQRKAVTFSGQLILNNRALCIWFSPWSQPWLCFCSSVTVEREFSVCLPLSINISPLLLTPE